MIRLFVVFGFIVFLFGSVEKNDSINPLEYIESNYHQNINSFNSSIEELIVVSNKFKKKEISLQKLQSVCRRTRNKYKKVEPYVEYFHREAVARFINGAPLPKLETAAPEHLIITPLGLQTLDETIFLSTGYEASSDIVVLSNKLQQFWQDITKIEKGRKLQHRYVMEAWRYQLIRIFTLGLTGFDTPGSVAGIDESIVSLRQMKSDFSIYIDFLTSTEAEALMDVMKVLNQFIIYLTAHNDFDTLDRLHVLRTFINPLYRSIYEFQQTMGIEFVDEVDPTLSAVNYHAQNLFSDHFLNKSFYAQIADSDLTDPKIIKLGKILFYDPVLSGNMKMSCASCHQPQNGFADGLAKSQSNQKNINTLRNSPTILNSVFAEKYFYDLREYDLERQVKHVVYDKKEFNIDFIELVDRLKLSDDYMAMFHEAYGDRDKYGISSWSISNALAAYVASLTSWNSPFDQYARGEKNEIAPAVVRGFNLFMGKAACGTCHFAPAFNGTVPPIYRESESEVLGVPEHPDTSHAKIDPDPGRIASGQVYDEVPHFKHSFKTTTVRNIAITGPYMHNGVYQSLEEVLDFYNRGGGVGIGIDLAYQTLPSSPLNLTDAEMSDIISFMKSLTDTTDLTSMSSYLPVFNIDSIDARKIDY